VDSKPSGDSTPSSPVKVKMSDISTSLKCKRVQFFKESFEIDFYIRMDIPCLLSMNTVERCCELSVIREVPGITDCYITQPQEAKGEYAVQTDGVNFDVISTLSCLEDKLGFSVDSTRTASNDIAAILKKFGVEAARNAIVREISSVFAVYGISVDPRHLFLLADYMTVDGGFRPLNRYEMRNSSSPLLKVTFETSSGFLTDAILFNEKDDLQTASSRIVAGLPVQVGTGCFDLLQPLSL